MSSDKTIKIGVGGCLVGQDVRYNGDHKRSNKVIESLRPFVDFMPMCPEVGIGLGVPRETIRLVVEGEDTRLKDSNTQTKDHTNAMVDYSLAQSEKIKSFSGYIFVKGSPSCGVHRVGRYTEEGNPKDSKGQGVFVKQVLAINPLLPVEDDARLHDPNLRERFIVKVYTYHSWQQLQAEGLSHKALIDFWSDHKYLVMSRHYQSYKDIGRLLAAAGSHDVEQLGTQLIEMIMAALTHVPTRKGHVNVLQHIKGYLKNKLTRDESRDIDEKIEQYRTNVIPLIVPMSLLSHQFKRFENDYISRQVFMSPYPEQLSLRNAL
jgi:uncharacterized protein YbgA (DUF1722 family)/uncharacterized protein YbbK (DUF523 family)